MAILATSQDALSSLSFCVDYKSRPHNCGACSKCTRTKLMFLAATGKVPDIFNDKKIDSNALSTIKLTKNSERAFFIDLYFCAKNNGTLSAIPNLEVTFSSLKKIDKKSSRDLPNYLNKLKRRLFKS